MVPGGRAVRDRRVHRSRSHREGLGARATRPLLIRRYGATEGITNLIKVVKRQGFGYRNFENFRLRVLYRCG
jgi:hypothetical protein